MYQLRTKIQDIILLFNDFLCLVLSYYIAGYIWLIEYKNFTLRSMLDVLNSKFFIILFALAVIEIFFNSNSDFFKRNKTKEIKTIIKINLILAAIIAIIDLIMGNYDIFSRGVYILTIFINIILMGVTRKIIKIYLIKVRKHKIKTSQLLLITTKSRIENVLNHMNRKSEWLNKISSIVIIDGDMTGQAIQNIPVVATRDNMFEYVKTQIIDEVFINLPYNFEKSLRNMIMEFENMGVDVHINIDILDDLNDFNKVLNYMGDIPVITFRYNSDDNKILFKHIIKRLIDVIGSFVGIIITLIVMIFLAPCILIESKGPLFFKQKRVGRNGRCFYIYKFRSMYNNAENLKSSLMEKNEMTGFMFKIENDPRITKVGHFIRKYSIDELPQFFNVFMGDMSLVGTRPPTYDEFKQYESYHKRRLCTKPGMTGLWQVSGKNDIHDFEEVVKLDLKYIDNWDLWLDFKILFKTLIIIFKKPGV